MGEVLQSVGSLEYEIAGQAGGSWEETEFDSKGEFLHGCEVT